MVLKGTFLMTTAFQRYMIYKAVILQNIYMLILKRKQLSKNIKHNCTQKLSTKTTLKTLQMDLNLMQKSRTNAPS